MGKIEKLYGLYFTEEALKSTDYVIVYDAECMFCQRFKQGIEFMDRDHRVEFASLHSQEIYLAHPQLCPNECQKVVHMVRKNDATVFRGGDIAAELAKLLPGVSKFAWLLETNRGKQAADFFYEKVDQLKKRRSKSCSSC
jgi:predicted DCC family thiol-disulfide oxidoreductase YuxK